MKQRKIIDDGQFLSQIASCLGELRSMKYATGMFVTTGTYPILEVETVILIIARDKRPSRKKKNSEQLGL